MNFDLILALVFYGLLFLFFLMYRNKFKMQGILALYKTQLGIKLMDKLAKKYPKLLEFLSYFSIFIGFAGMFFIIYILIQGTYKLIYDYLIGTQVQPVIAPVLPGVSISPQLPVLGFWHWIVAIFIVAVVHEFAHGVYARLYNLKVKNSGFAFLGPILAAFVEPDEKELKKMPAKKQLAIVSAGPFVNIMLAFLIILFFSFIFAPLQGKVLEVDGVTLVHVEEGLPADKSGLKSGMLVKEVNNQKINSQRVLISAIQNSKENEILKLTTDKGTFYVKPEIMDNVPKIGVNVRDNVKVIEGLPAFLLPMILWFNLLFYWLWLINLGIGLFNLLPLGPIDGGRMFLISMLIFTKNEKKAFNLYKLTTFICATLIFINLLPWLVKLFAWIFGFFS